MLIKTLKMHYAIYLLHFNLNNFIDLYKEKNYIKKHTYFLLVLLQDYLFLSFFEKNLYKVLVSYFY